MSLYRALAEHITQGRAEDVDTDALHEWMVATDTGSHPAWEAFDATLDGLLSAYRSERLEYLRGELRAERISYGELAELQSLADHIDRDDVELLEAAGVPEHKEV